MDDLKSVTVSYLRDLARKHLGPGYSKLNKTQLIGALAEFVPAVKKLAQLVGIPVSGRAKPAASKSAAAPAKASREARSGEKKPERKQESDKKAPEKREPERKKEPEGKKVPEKKDPEGKKGPQKKGPEPKKAAEKKAPEKSEPAKKTAAPQAPKAAAPQAPKTAAPQAPKVAAPQEAKAAAPQAPKAAAPQEPKAAAPQEPKQAPSRERKPKTGRSAAKAEELAQSLRPAQVVNFPPRPRSQRNADGSWNEDSGDLAGEQAEAPPSRPAEPLLEGFFVARVVGERELRRHRLTEEQAPRAVTSNATGYEENLGELPVDYASDVAMALARDPHTLFVSWDFSPVTLARAKEGLDSPRPVLRVYEGDRVVRVEEFVIEARSFYIHGLPPGRSYRVEAHFVGRDGRSRRIGPSTHPVVLPQAGLSEDTRVRFMRMHPPPPPTASVAPQPVMAPPEPTRQIVVDEGEFITWNRVPLPGSADLAEVLERRRERVVREAPPPAGPGAPERALPPHLEVYARPLGASELAAARGQPLAGALEQSAAAGHGRGGASEQIHWTPPPSGRGR